MEAEMAAKITVALEDDLEGGPADETVRFAVDGAELEIDLNKKNAAAFHGQLAPFIEHARKAGRKPRRWAGRTVLVNPAELSNLIDKLNDLGEAEREFIKVRWLRYVQWWDSRARRAKIRYNIFRTAVVVGGAAIPVLLALAEVDQLADSAFRFTIASIITSGIVAICAGIESLFNFGDIWREKRDVCELIKSEGFNFFQLSGDYTGKSRKDAYLLFASKVEELIRVEIKGYIRAITPKPETK
jgi:hypothetical protein